MIDTAKTIYVPFGGLILAAGLLLPIIAIIIRRALKAARDRSQGHHHRHEHEHDWSVPVLDACSNLHSVFHRWDPRLKIFSILVYCFLVAALNHIIWAFCAFILSLVAVRLAKIPFRNTKRRLMAMVGFLGMFLVIMPLTVPTQPGDLLLFFPPVPVPFNVRGFLLAVRIILKACAIALMMEPLLNTAPLPVTIQALRHLKVPDMICQMILLAHRYIYVFLNEANRMYTGMRVRGFRQKTNLATLYTMGNFLGMLFVSSFDRTQRVYDAMLSRGYNGSFPVYTDFSARPKDWLFGITCILLGTGLLILDRIGAFIIW
jgi:cobalt/nickel transport system permease protein